MIGAAARLSARELATHHLRAVRALLARGEQQQVSFHSPGR